MEKKASEKLIDTVPEVPKNVESPIVTPKNGTVKPTTQEEDHNKRKKEVFKSQQDLVSPELIYEWASRDAKINQKSLENSIKDIIANLELSKELADQVWDYHKHIYEDRKKTAMVLNKIVDEIGNGFESFHESFKYMTMDMSKRDRYKLKKYARKAGFDI